MLSLGRFAPSNPSAAFERPRIPVGAVQTADLPQHPLAFASAGDAVARPAANFARSEYRYGFTSAIRASISATATGDHLDHDGRLFGYG
jgi:hypothetical protein